MVRRTVFARLGVFLVVFTLCAIGATYSATASNAAPATTPCSGWNGHRNAGLKEYNCSFNQTSPVRSKYNAKVGMLAAGTNWVLCQRKGSTIRLGTRYYNYWWAFTEADNGTYGWVNAVHGSAGDNNGAFRGVPLCPTSAKYTPPIVRAASTGGVGAAILRAALSQRGQPYVFAGGSKYGPTRGGFDCSGLVVYAVYKATHKVLYHQAAYQWQHSASEGAVRVSQANLRPGDIVFFVSSGTRNAPGHVGIYNGLVNGRRTVIDAYDHGYPLGRRYFSQESGGFSGAIRF